MLGRLLPKLHSPVQRRAFNSLFEMRRPPRLCGAVGQVLLSILYLRCRSYTIGSYVDGYAFNSLFEMPTIATALLSIAQQVFSFNSLFEMHQPY